MKIIFWTFAIGAFIVWFMRQKWGGGNDLTTHFAEQKSLQQIGSSATSASQIGSENNPLSTFGQLPLSGMRIDPFDPDNPFSQPQSAQVGLAVPVNGVICY